MNYVSHLFTVPTDDNGMDMDALERLITEYKDKGTTQITDKKPFRALIYIIPFFNNPTGRCMAPGKFNFFFFFFFVCYVEPLFSSAAQL